MRYIFIKILLIIFFTSANILPGTGQPLGIELDGGKSIAQMPFEIHNNLIVVSVRFNNTLPLKFILDTGAQYTIFSKKELADVLNVEYGKRITIYGSDRSTVLHATLAHNISLKLPNVSMKNQTILVLDDDYLNLEYLIGTPIHGILGTDLFKRFTVKIDYYKKVITLYEPSSFTKPSSDYETVYINILSGKPYTEAEVEMKQGVHTKLTFLLDSGASLALVLHPNTDTTMTVPDKLVKGHLGYGLGGELEGFLGRVTSLKFQKFEFKNLISNFQELPPLEDSTYFIDRNGFIGGGLLTRFTCIFDFINNSLYLKPNKQYYKAFKEDKSGLVLYATGRELNVFIVRDIIQNSPAEKAGIRPGDEILRINGRFHSNFSLREINKIFQRKTGRRIKILLRRHGIKMQMKITLTEFI